MSNEEVFGQPDNIEAAMAKVAETIKPTRRANTGADEGSTASKQVLIRTTDEDHARWKMAADVEGITLSEFLRKSANSAASDILDCKHPAEFVKWYPWQMRCTKCGARWK
jgi:activator of 2-hydroxyglutaryl-CoA dehydratase